METQTGGPVFNLVTGRLDKGKLLYPRVAGTAHFVVEDAYYLLRLAMFPQNRWYVKKNGRDQNGYTVYAEYDRTRARGRFLYPIGFGRLSDRLKTHMEIRLPLLGRSLFMDLYPTGEAQNETA